VNDDEVTLKLRMPAERYIALRHIANEEGRSMNGHVNFLIKQVIINSVSDIKNPTRGQKGVNCDD
jgi:hypothetical protein